MVNRKIMAAIYTSILAVIVLNIIEPFSSVDGGWVKGVLVYSTYVIPVIFIYGIISSVISDKLSLKVKKFSNEFSFMLHILFGIAFVLPYGVLFDSIPFLELSMVEILIYPITILSRLSLPFST